jgi:S1-C subfamily serine protease
VVIFGTLLLLAACGIGLGIGYAVFSSTPVTTSPTATTPKTPSTTSPKVAAITAKVDPGLVDVDTTLSYQTVSGAGTGMVVTSSGEVLTNNHVIEGETSLHVTDVGNGKTYTATVVGYDVTDDVAVLQMEGASHLDTVTFEGARAKVGEGVVAIGNAQGKGGTPTAVTGTVTGLDQSITAENALSATTEHLRGLIETDAPIQEGDSGGPLVDDAGKVLGMDTAGSSSFAFARGTTEGFAIPIGSVRAVATEIVRLQPSSTVHIGPTAFLGVEVVNVGTTGAVVAEVLPGTAAAAIGLSPGDTIMSLAGQAIRNPTTLSVSLQGEKPGATVSIGWEDRFGQSHTATATLTSGPPL